MEKPRHLFLARAAMTLTSALTRRTAAVLLLAVLNATTAWAIKNQPSTTYSLKCTNGKFKITNLTNGSSQTDSWDASIIGKTAYWKANEEHDLSDNISIKPDENVLTTNITGGGIHTAGSDSTTFTFTIPYYHDMVITSVVFKGINGNELSATYSEPGKTYTATLPSGTTITGFTLTYGFISGKCGDFIEWELSKENGQYTKLTIEGSNGTMYDYGHDEADIWHTDAPWGYDLTSVRISNYITSIGDNAFIGCQQLSSIDIGSYITTIGKNAFDHCDALTEVTLPATVTTINDAAFKNCSGLKRININTTNGLVTLGSNVFKNDNALHIALPTLPIALQYMSSTNWSAYKDKLRVAFGSQLFTATNQGGTPAYAITSETDLRNLALALEDNFIFTNNFEVVNIAEGKTFRQTGNLELSNTNFKPINTGVLVFQGTYDGGGYTISGLHISNFDRISLYGLFSDIGESGTVKNVRLVNPTVNVDGNDNNCGALIGKAFDGTVQNCVVINPSIGGNAGYKGAIVGKKENEATLQNLYFYDGNLNNAIGTGDSDTNVTNVGRVRKVILGSGISSVSPAINATDTNLDNGFVYKDNLYYREGIELTPASNLSATGKHVVYKAGNNTLTGNTYTVSSGDVTLTAELVYNTYTVEYKANGGSGSMSNQTFTYGTAQNLTANAFTRKGYSFAGWATSENGNVVYSDKQSVNNLTTTNGGTVTLYAKWTPDTYTITYNLNGGTLSTNKNSYTIESPDITLDTPTRTGFNFGGWYTNSSLTDPAETTIAHGSTGNMEYWAKWLLPYIDADGQLKETDSYTVLTGSESTSDTELSTRWYVVTGNVSYSGTLNCTKGNGNMHLVLCDGASLTIDCSDYAINAPNLTIYGQTQGTGTLNATAIGLNISCIYAHNNLTINGGIITANSSNNNVIYAKENITINGGSVKASGQNGIVADGSITINGGNVEASGSYAISANKSITINGGSVKTGNGNNGIYTSNGDITINGGNIEVRSRYGIRAYRSNIILGWTNATDYITASGYYAEGAVKIADGQTLTDGTADYAGTLDNKQKTALAGKTLLPLETLNLSDNGNNAEAIGEAAAAHMTKSTGESYYNVTLNGRTLYKDGDWNTLCLPFDLSAEQIAASPLAGATIMELDGTHSDLTDGTLTLNFNDATEMVAGRPYIVKWPLARTISSSDDWHDFAADVAGGNTYEGKMVWLAADIEVSEMVGTSEYKFKGIFNGQGHTLTLNDLSASKEAACAPFRYVEGATIANLHTTGTVKADNNTASKFRSGLVGQSDGNTTIHNCWSSVTISSGISGDGTHGGFIGVSDSGNATISNCRFDGSFSGSSTNSWGGFVGWSSSTTTISNSVFAPEGISITQTNSATFSRNQVNTTNCYYSQALNDVTNDATAIGSTSVNDLAKDLGSGWQVKDGKAVPVTASMDIVNPVFSPVTVSDDTNDVTFNGGSFKGTYSPVTWNTEDKSILFLGGNNALYYPQAGAHVNAFRAYFELSTPNGIREFNLNFDEQGTQTIIGHTDITDSTDKADAAWYTINGVKLDKMPTKKGIYIHGGRKVVVK